MTYFMTTGNVAATFFGKAKHLYRGYLQVDFLGYEQSTDV